ncbi:P2Y purinoceptor 6-like [Trichomycterus rosablanca]|uniref:P2Y purinoceptor 6-like n=1 Tax=Trichomycterus rosablanca TaxID=2290929 RepID=UPI002F359AB1
MGGAGRQKESREQPTVSMNPLLINNSDKHEHHKNQFLDYPNETTLFCSQFKDDQWYCSILLVLFVFGLPVGVLGNIVAILNYTCCRHSWTTGTVFLLNLALCDITWLLFLPFTLYFSLHQPHLPDINMFCQFKKVFFNINVYGSILFLALISFDRYTGTVHPISSLRWWDGKKACLCSIFTWIILVLASIPDFFMTFAFTRPGNITVCMDHIHGPFSYVATISVLRALLGFLLPLSIMGAIYARMVKVLKSMPGKKNIRGKRFAPRRTGKPLILITAAVLVFLVSYAPYHIMIVTLVFMRFIGKVTVKNVNTLYTAYEFLEAMCSISSCLDPLLYILASQHFQQRWRKLKRSLCCRNNRRVGIQNPA